MERDTIHLYNEAARTLASASMKELVCPPMPRRQSIYRRTLPGNTPALSDKEISIHRLKRIWGKSGRSCENPNGSPVFQYEEVPHSPNVSFSLTLFFSSC